MPGSRGVQTSSPSFVVIRIRCFSSPWNLQTTLETFIFTQLLHRKVFQLRISTSNVSFQRPDFNHRQFFSYFPAGISWASIMGDIFSNDVGANGTTWDSCPADTKLEIIVMDWACKFLGLPDFFLSHFSNPKSEGGGTIQTSASDAILNSMLCAREDCVHSLRLKYPTKPRGVLLEQMVAYCSSQCHSFVEKDGMIGTKRLKQLPADENGSVRAHTLRSAINEDIDRGLIPYFYCGSLGSTGAFDDLMELGPVCEEFGMWMHVDAAYAGSCFICPEMRHLTQGFQYAWSTNVNANEWMLTNFDASLHFVRYRKKLIDAFTGYDPEPWTSPINPIIQLKHDGLPSTRRFRSFKLWCIMRNYGSSGLQKYVRNHIYLAKLFERYVGRDERFEVVGPVGMACFRLKGTNDINKKLFDALNLSRKIHLVPSAVHEKFVIRFAICAEDANEKDIDDAWRIISELATATLHLEQQEQDSSAALRPLFEKQHKLDSFEHPDKQRDAETRDAETQVKVHKTENIVDGADFVDGSWSAGNSEGIKHFDMYEDKVIFGETKSVDRVPSKKLKVPPSSGSVYDFIFNSLLLDKTLKYLSFSEVKAVSAVNTDFLRAVRGSHRWHNVVLNGTKNTKEFKHYVRRLELEVPLSRRVKIDVQLSPKTLEHFPRVLRSVEFLALLRITPSRDSHTVDTKLPKILLSVLSSTPNLTHLQVDIRFWTVRLNDALTSPKTVAILKNLKHLDILEPDYENPGTFRGHHGRSFYVHSNSPNEGRDVEDNESKVEDEEPFADNFLNLSKIPMRLESFRMARVFTDGGSRRNRFLQPLLAILSENKETLKNLSVHRIVWRSQELRVLNMPSLKCLTVSVDTQHHQDTLAAFLENHSALEELDIEGRWGIDQALLSVIQNCRKIKKLRLKTPCFNEGTVNWSFLGTLEHLKDFSIVRPDPEGDRIRPYGTGRDFLAALPKNQLESLRLTGISKIADGLVDFWGNLDDEFEFNFYLSPEFISRVSRVDEGAELESKIQLFQGFTCLRTLSLINCLDSLDDSLMQFVLMEFKLLEVLEVSHCPRLSDAGIAGTGETPNSIANLRCLKSLIIRECGRVTPNGLLSCLSLPCLQSLEFMTFHPVQKSFVLKLAEQNPRLESLAVNFSGNWSQLKKKLKGKNTRLKRVGDPIKDDVDSEE